VTEARPGVYMFQDLFQAEIGSCEKGDIAMTVLASVIGTNVDAGRILIDAGAIALSKDRSTQATEHDAGFGEIRDINNGYGLGDQLGTNDPGGIQRGILFFQNRAVAANPSWQGGGVFLLSGSMYFHQCVTSGSDAR